MPDALSDYFESAWIEDGAAKSAKSTKGFERESLPVALNLEALYELMLERLIPLRRRTDESMPALVERAEQMKKLEREIGGMGNKIRKEKQFNRKVELNQQLRHLRATQENLRK